MTQNNQTETTEMNRRSWLKKASVATGATVLGVAGLSGGAAAQPQNLQIDADNLVTSNGLLTITIGNVKVLNHVLNNSLNNLDLTVTVENVLNDLSVDISDVSVLSNNVVAVNVQDVLNNADVDVAALNNVDVSLSVGGSNLGGTDTVQVI